MKTSIYKKYLLGVLLVILTCNYLDRAVLAMALQGIKADLHLSDTQLGLLSGIAFALFYSVMGIPIARWADRGNRITIIFITTVLWSVMVALCGSAGSFLQLMLLRSGVAVGEAGCIPPAHSLIADYFNRAERPRAVAWYSLGGPLSVVVGYFLAGWLMELHGWRATFVILGLPGVMLGLLAYLTLREPRRARAFADLPAAGSMSSTEPAAPAASLNETCRALWSNGTYRNLLFCFSVLFFFGQGIWQWQPAYFVRSYGMQTGELGIWFAMSVGVTGILGTVLGGELASRIAGNNERLQLRSMAIAYCGFAVISAGVYLSANRYLAFALIALASFGGAMANGPLFAMVQTTVPSRMRAIAIALIYLVANLVGLGLGPLAAGMLSDGLRAWVGDESLRYALLILCPGYFWGAWHLWKAGDIVAGDVRAARADRLEGVHG